MKKARFYFGVGTDLKRLLSESYDGVRYFVDPGIPKNFKDLHRKVGLIYRMTFENFISFALGDEKITNDLKECEIYSDRMIEHIEFGQLVSLTFPLMQALTEVFKAKVEIVYPDIEAVVQSLNDNLGDFRKHEMCNIEAIAFGEHKCILSEGSIRVHFKHLSSPMLFSQPFKIDGKCFYRRFTMESDRSALDAKLPIEPLKWYGGCLNYATLSELLWILSNDIDNDIKENDVYGIEYISHEKMYVMEAKIKKYISSRSITLYDDDVVQLLEGEEHFKIIPGVNEYFNIVHPYKNRISFKHVSNKDEI